MFQTDDAWKARNSGAIRLDLNELGSRKYWCMELPLNLPLFHVDLGKEVDGELAWSRYQVMEFDHVEEFLALDGFVVRLSLQTRRSDVGNYEIVRITEILRANDGTGNVGYIYVDMNGQRHPDFRWHGDVILDSSSCTIWTDRSPDLLG